MGVFLGDGFALLGHAEVAFERAMRQRPDKPIGRAGPAADGAAAPVEETQLHPVFHPDRGERLLRVVERPLAREDATVLVAVAIAEHDLLGGAIGRVTIMA